MTTLAIVVSCADSASVHVGEHLLELADWREEHDGTRPDGEGGGTVYRLDDAELREFDAFHLTLDGVDAVFDTPDLLAFASRHAGETGPLLTAHVTGNFGPAEFGGRDATLARAAPNAQVAAVESLRAYAPDGYDVGMECTHHGPTDVDTPSLFVELGSAEPQWADPDGARAVARAILDLRDVDPQRGRTVVGFGGGHYVPRFERVVRETDWAVGHVAADWCLDAMGEPDEHRDVVRKAFERSGASHALVDGEFPALERVIEELGYRVVSETWLRETTGVSLSFTERIEREVERIDDGLRFGERAPRTQPERDLAVPEDAFTIVDLPTDLLNEVNGIDRERVLTDVTDRAVAVTTDEGGTRLSGTVILSGDSDRNELIDALVTVLTTKYDRVERDGDQIVAHEIAFSPALARKQGVPEGPAFGKLAGGTPVEIDDRVVAPADVREHRTHMFSSI